MKQNNWFGKRVEDSLLERKLQSASTDTDVSVNDLLSAESVKGSYSHNHPNFFKKTVLTGAALLSLYAGIASAACLPGKTITETVTTTVTQTITIPPYHTAEQLKDRFDFLTETIKGGVVDWQQDYRTEVDELAAGLYYYVTGHTVKQDGFRLIGLTNDEYQAELLRLSGSGYNHLKNSVGFTGLITNGLMDVYARADQRVIDYVFTRFHELGIGRARLVPNNRHLNQSWGEVFLEASGLSLDTVLRDLLDGFGVPSFKLARTSDFEKYTLTYLDYLINNVDLGVSEGGVPFKDAYDGGFQVVWGLTLNDPAAEEELLKNGRTSWQTSFRLHNQLINYKNGDEIKTLIWDTAKNYASIDPQMRGILFSGKRLNGSASYNSVKLVKALLP